MFSGVSIQRFACFTGGLVSRILPGWESALNHHSAFVHFPIALWLAALLFEVVALWRRNDIIHRAAMWLLWLGTIAATFAVVTGLQAANRVPSGVGNLLHTHRELMLISYFLAAGLSLLAVLARSQSGNWVKVALLGVSWPFPALWLLELTVAPRWLGATGSA